MSWQNVKLPEGGRLIKNHTYTYIYSGTNYNIFIDEYMDGNFSGYAEHTTDSSNMIQGVSAKSLEECIQLVIAKLNSKHTS